MQRFKSQGQAQRFVSTHSTIYNTFALQRHLISRNTMRKFRSAAMAEWLDASAAAAWVLSVGCELVSTWRRQPQILTSL